MDNLARILTAAAGIALVAGPTAAQEPEKTPLPTVVEGLTLDALSGLPFPNVQLRFDTGERITSDEQGRYMIDGIQPGYHRVALVTGRCNVTFADLELAPGEIKRIAFQVPSEMVGVRPGHEELRKRSEGEYYSSDELEEMSARNLLDVLRRVAPDMVGPQSGLPGASPTLVGRTRTARGVAEPIVVFDGIQVGDGVRALRDFKPADVYSMEILRGAGRGWEYGTGGAGGVIKIVTQSGDLGYGVEHPDRCDIGDWTGRSGTPS
jgi:hypothetical protein